MRRALLLLAAAGCFDPTYPVGLTCNPNCPPGQVCNPATFICEVPAPDASTMPGTDAAMVDCNGVTCTNEHGSTECIDMVCVPTCEGAYLDCDGMPENGCEVTNDENYDCATWVDTTTFMPVGADVMDSAQFSNRGEAFFKVILHEAELGAIIDLTATITLDVPPDADYDLYVYCDACDGTLAGQSNFVIGEAETVEVGRTDIGPDAQDQLDVVVEVRHVFTSSCAPWTLTVQGGTMHAARPCD